MARNKHPEETVAKILDVALELFFARGYDNTSIQDIIDHLGGLTKGAVYHHFKSKEDILETSVNGSQLEIWSRIAPSTDPVKNSRLLGLQYRSVFEETVPYYVQPIIEQGMRDGTIQTDQPKELAEVLVLLANLWAGPMFNAASPDSLQSRIAFYVKLAEGLGVSIASDGVQEALERYRSTFAEKTREISEDNEKEDTLP